jgi:hypothetical protein
LRAYALLHVLSASAFGLCAGCIWWWPDHGFRNGIRAESRAALAPGRVTREDVLCELGAPAWACVDGTRFVYFTHVVESRGWLFMGDVVEFAWGNDDFLLFEFDENGVLSRQRQVSRTCPDGMREIPGHAEFEALFAAPAPGR